MATCRICSCTDEDCSKCIEKTGQPCSWVEPDLCSACIGWTVQTVARDLALKLELPGVLVMLYDEKGALHSGAVAADHHIAKPFIALAQSIDIACERGLPGFAGLSREKAIEIADRSRRITADVEHSVELEMGRTFLLKEWVIRAIIEASSTLPPIPAQCLHCGEPVEREAAREHVMTCTKSPLVQELQKLRAELAEQYPIAITARAMCNSEATEADLREIIDRVLNATQAARLEYLPARLRGGS